MENNRYILSFVYAIIFILSIITDSYGALVILMLLVSIGMILSQLGKTILLKEGIILFSTITCLFAPMLGYQYYPADDRLSKLWGYYMHVPFDEYFGYVIPALSVFFFALTYPIKRIGGMQEHSLIQSIYNSSIPLLQRNKRNAVYLLLIGMIAHLLGRLLPFEISYIGELFFYLSFVGLLYIYVVPQMRYKYLWIMVFLAFLIWDTARGGMFTVIVYMGLTIFSYFFLYKRLSSILKVFLLTTGIMVLMVIQSIKPVLRLHISHQEADQSNISLLLRYSWEQILDYHQLFSKEALYSVYVRSNEGMNISLVMSRIPVYQDFDGGNALFLNIVSSFVPRFAWPDKPEAGGKFNMAYYAGIKLEGWSTNVSPLGEAYGSFGKWGGILYMFFLGLFIRWVYQTSLKLSFRTPLLLYWLPILFFPVTYAMEADTLQILNSVIKTSVFIWVLYHLFPAWFGRFGYMVFYKKQAYSR